METKERLDNALRDAMRSGNDLQKRAIRMARASIKNEEVNKGRPLDEAEVIAVLQKEIKIRSESIEGARSSERSDLIKESQEEIALLESFLPEQLSDDEIRQLAQEAIAEVQAIGMGDMGKVMKALLPRIQGRAPNDRVSQIVRNQLAA